MDVRSNPPTVLLVQQDDDNLQMYLEYLQSRGVPCVAVSTAADALARAADVHVVVTGILLRGGADGIELLQQLRADDRTRPTPVIVLTACALDTERQRAEDAGCNAFLAKPCFPETLLQTVQRVVAQSRVDAVKGRPAKGRLRDRRMHRPAKRRR